MSSLKLNGVNKIYPSGTVAVYDANLQTSDKEFLVILGAEGSGKTTLLRLIAGLDDVSDGSIFIDDKEITELDPKDRDIAMVFRNNTLYPTLNVFDNMGYGLKLRKASPTLIEERVKAAAKILGVEDILYRKPKTLTSAQRQRVAIGRAIVREPKLYLLDEPLVGLDENLASTLLDVIINMQARMEGTFIYATKDLSEAMTIGTRIVVMKGGTIQQIDEPKNLYDYPANAYVAFYIGAPTINFINSVKLVGSGDEVKAEAGEFCLTLPQSIVSRFKNIGEYLNTDKRVILGIRPEDITAVNGVDGEITKIENDGDDYYAECIYEGQTFVVKTQAERPKGLCSLEIAAERVHIFDGVTRLTLLERDAGYHKTEFADADRQPLSFPEEEELLKTLKAKKAQKKK